MTRSCHYCNEPEQITPTGRKELRPYGPGGALVCFDCAYATPARAAETGIELQRAMNRIESQGFDIMLTDHGFLPVKLFGES